MIRVFVYGTLKKGEPNHHVISETGGAYRFVGTGRTINMFPLIITSKYNIPALLAKPGEGHVGFLFQQKKRHAIIENSW